MQPRPEPVPPIVAGAVPGSRVDAAWLGWSLPMGFVALAMVLFALSRDGEMTYAPAAMVDRGDLVVKPRRAAMSDPAHILVDGSPQNCNGCHQIFQSNSAAGANLNFHGDIRLLHGLNNRCTNCHDPENRERLTLRDGASVPFAQTPQLCAQCHGTVFRDWERGTHGKTLGSWMTHSDAQRRLNCNECHNPHSPKFEPTRPLPGPNTLRMGAQPASPSHDHGQMHSPLQRWLRELDAAKTMNSTSKGGHQ